MIFQTVAAYWHVEPLTIAPATDLITTPDIEPIAWPVPTQGLKVLWDFLGTRADDIFTGTASDEAIHGGNGNNTLSGGGGHDWIVAGTGNDRIFGGKGNDHLSSGSGIDALFGGSGNDEIYGDAGRDRLAGGAGNDVLWGGYGNDIIKGNGGADTLIGGGGDDRLFGGAGADILRADGGNIYLNGGGGNDTFYLDFDTSNTSAIHALVGGKGRDLLNLETQTTGQIIDLMSGDKGASKTESTYTGIEDVIGTAYDDVIKGTHGNNTIASDWGADIVFGGRGADTISLGGHDATAYGGEGNDTITVSGSGAHAYGDAGDDVLTGSSASFFRTTLSGGDGNDTLYGGAGGAKMDGGAGDDRLVAQNADVMTGGTGADTFAFLNLDHKYFIQDFDTNTDTIEIDTAATGLANYNDILALMTIADDDVETVLTIATSTDTWPDGAVDLATGVVVRGVDLYAISADNFVFV